MASSLVGRVDCEMYYMRGVANHFRKHGFTGFDGFCFGGLIVKNEMGEVEAHEELRAWLYCIVSIAITGVVDLIVDW